MAKKPRENRIPIMMSDEELTSIDDWRFANRVATRSEAVRRLCQMGLILDEELKPAINKTTDYFASAVNTPPTLEDMQELLQILAIRCLNASAALRHLNNEDKTDVAIQKTRDLYEYWKKCAEKDKTSHSNED